MLSPLIEAQRAQRDARFYKVGGTSEVTLIIPATKHTNRRSFRCFFTMEAIAFAQRMSRVLGDPRDFMLTVEAGRIDLNGLAIIVAGAADNKRSREDPETSKIAANPDAVLELLTTHPGLHKYWAPIACVAMFDAYDRDEFALETEDDPRLAPTEVGKRGEEIASGV